MFPPGVPFGSMWRVDSWVAPSARAIYESRGQNPPEHAGQVVRVMTHPAHKVWLNHNSDVQQVEFPHGTLLFVGETVPSRDGGGVDFVQVLIPQHAYINRLHFNEGSPYLTRIA